MTRVFGVESHLLDKEEAHRFVLSRNPTSIFTAFVMMGHRCHCVWTRERRSANMRMEICSEAMLLLGKKGTREEFLAPTTPRTFSRLAVTPEALHMESAWTPDSNLASYC